MTAHLGPLLACVGVWLLGTSIWGLLRGRVRALRIRSRRASAGLLVLSFVVVLVGGALTPSSAAPDRSATAATGRQSLAGPVSTAPGPSPSADPSPRPSPAALAPPTGPGPTSAAPTTAPPTSRQPTSDPVLAVVAAAGTGRPDPRRTPGHVFPAATRATVCVSGYSRRVRHVTAAVRQEVFAAYGIGYPPPPGRYELDHLVPLELGGDNTAANLWPEVYHGAASADVKDHLENHLHALVCSGQVPLPEAQRAMAGDWFAAAARYDPIQVVRTAPAPARAPAPAPAPAPEPVPAPAPADPGGATALCNDGTLSYAAHHRGACSHHGGVAVFYQ